MYISDDAILKMERTRAKLEQNVKDKGVEVTEGEDMNTLVNKVREIGYNDVMRSILDGSIEEYVDYEITNLRVRAFGDCKKLQKAVIPNVSDVGTSIFANCSALTEVDLSGLVTLNATLFQSCTSLPEIVLNNIVSCNTSNGSSTFGDCTILKRVSFLGMLTLQIGSSTFQNCNTLDTLVFGQDCSLGHITGLSAIPKVKTGECFFYFPKSLVEKKKTDTNWSTFADLIRAIEDYPEVLEWAVKNGYISESEE